MALIKSVKGFVPVIEPTAFVAENATIIGEVFIDEEASVWYGAVLRGDVGAIHIGKRSNVQDLCMVHCTTDHSKTIVGEDVTIGHNAVLHGCVIEDCCLIGMGAVLLDNAVVKSNTIVAAGSVVLENQVLEAGYLYAGAPAKQMKPLSSKQILGLKENAAHYLEAQTWYK